MNSNVNGNFNSPYNAHYKFDHTIIKNIRFIRGLTIEAFAVKCKLHPIDLRLIEAGEVDFSSLYYSKICDGLREINFTDFELETIKKINQNNQRGNDLR